jgi:uncharacterized protein YkwD
VIPRRRALAALIAAVCSACPSAAPSAAGRDAQAQDLLREMNRVRAEHGLPALRADARLMLAAQRHAEDMAAGNRLDHRGSDGSGLRERAQRAGYAFSRISENLAAGQASAGAVVRTWLDSPPHRRNLLDPDLRHAGAGYVFRPAEAGTRRYGHYWAANFGRPAE